MAVTFPEMTVGTVDEKLLKSHAIFHSYRKEVKDDGMGPNQSVNCQEVDWECCCDENDPNEKAESRQ